MILYVDIDTGEIRRSLTGPVITGLVLYLRDILSLGIVYTQDGAAVTSTVLAGNAVQKIGLRANPAATTLLALASTYSLAGDVATATFSLNTSELVDYFTDTIGPVPREAEFYLEVEVSAADESTRQTYWQGKVIVRRDVNQPADTNPPDVDTALYVLKGSLFDASGNPITSKFPGVRFDITDATAHRAIITLGRTRPWMIFTLEGGIPRVWVYRDKGVGEVDDGTTLRTPNDYDAGTNNGIWANTTLA